MTTVETGHSPRDGSGPVLAGRDQATRWARRLPSPKRGDAAGAEAFEAPKPPAIHGLFPTSRILRGFKRVPR